MRASIVIPTYNGSRHLIRLLDCLRCANPARIAEVLICDDGSSEDIRTLMSGYMHCLPIKYLRQDRRGFRAGAARNMGIAVSTGDVILFLDQDIVLSPMVVDAHLAHHSIDSQPRLVIGFRKRMTGQSPHIIVEDHRIPILGLNGERIGASPIPWYYAFTCNLSVSATQREERFDETFCGWGNEDIEYAYRLWRKGVEIVCAPDAMVLHQDEQHLRDPFLNESRGQPADFTSIVFNTVRMMEKHPEDELLRLTLRNDLKGFAIRDEQCVRDCSCEDVDSVVTWALPRMALSSRQLDIHRLENVVDHA